jgi:hypothetical protein
LVRSPDVLPEGRLSVVPNRILCYASFDEPTLTPRLGVPSAIKAKLQCPPWIARRLGRRYDRSCHEAPDLETVFTPRGGACGKTIRPSCGEVDTLLVSH